LTSAEIESIPQSIRERVSLRDLARISKRSYNTVLDMIRAAFSKDYSFLRANLTKINPQALCAISSVDFLLRS